MGFVLFFQCVFKVSSGSGGWAYGWEKKKKKDGCGLRKAVQTLCEEAPALNLGRVQQFWVCY